MLPLRTSSSAHSEKAVPPHPHSHALAAGRRRATDRWASTEDTLSARPGTWDSAAQDRPGPSETPRWVSCGGPRGRDGTRQGGGEAGCIQGAERGSVWPEQSLLRRGGRKVGNTCFLCVRSVRGLVVHVKEFGFRTRQQMAETAQLSWRRPHPHPTSSLLNREEGMTRVHKRT